MPGSGTPGGGTLVCPRDGYRSEVRDGIRDLLLPEQLETHAGFIEEYRGIRSAEGRGSLDPAYYLALPTVPPDDPAWKEWRIRAESMGWLRERLGPMKAGGRLRILDAGAGNCWLTRRLAEWGHDVVALDLNVDPLDGLAAGRHYLEALPLTFERVRADFAHLPVLDASFDAVVFNGAVHYARDLRAVLAGAARVVAPGGAVYIIDSPIYSDFASGMKMRAERAVYGRAGFLTFNGLRLMAGALGLMLRVDRPRANLLRRFKRRLTEMRLGREIATMGRVELRVTAREEAAR